MVSRKIPSHCHVFHPGSPWDSSGDHRKGEEKIIRPHQHCLKHWLWRRRSLFPLISVERWHGGAAVFKTLLSESKVSEIATNGRLLIFNDTSRSYYLLLPPVNLFTLQVIIPAKRWSKNLNKERSRWVSKAALMLGEVPWLAMSRLWANCAKMNTFQNLTFFSYKDFLQRFLCHALHFCFCPVGNRCHWVNNYLSDDIWMALPT